MLFEDAVLNREIEVLELMFHAEIALLSNGIYTIHQLIILSEKEIKSIKGIGKVYFNDICIKVNKYFSAYNIALVFPLSGESIPSIISSQRKAEAFSIECNDADDIFPEYDEEDDLLQDWDGR